MLTGINSKELERLREDVVPLKPIWQPYNKAASDLLELILKSLPTPTSSTKKKKYSTVVASFLAVAQNVTWKVNGKLSIPLKRDHWSEYPDVGATIIDTVRHDLLNKGFISFVPDSGQRHFYKDEEDKLRWVGIQAVYTIDDSLANLEGFTDASWIEVGRPPVLVSKYETRGSMELRRKKGQRKPKLKINNTKKSFGKLYTITCKDITDLNTYWRKHPLALPRLGNGAQQYLACASRIYHDGSMDSGGRYYGSWTNFSSKYRLQSTIDGEAVVEIDLNASQPTLFSSLMGMKMDVGKSWDDLYTSIIKSNVNLTSIDEPEEVKRKKLKQVTVEVIGSGNPSKIAASKESEIKFSKDYDEYGWYRNQLTRSVPALGLLDNNYLNGSGFVSYHEAEIMASTLKQLMNLDVVAYPIHDCLLVKASNKDLAINTYRESINSYILEHCNKHKKEKINITVPVSVEELGQEKVRLKGYYS